MKLLSSKGIVEARRGSGTYVVTTAKGLSDPLNLRSVQDKNALALDLVNVRLLLEPGMAEMAALNASDEDIERIQRLCDRVESKIHSGDLYIEDDIAFHTCIAESSKNMVVEQLIPIIDTAVMMFVNVTHKKLTEETILTHRMITEAIARHDSIGARSAMVMHLTSTATASESFTTRMGNLTPLHFTSRTVQGLCGDFLRLKLSDDFFRRMIQKS